MVVVGATGTIGTPLIRALAADPRVGSVLGLSRRPPARPGPPGTSWLRADITTEPDLARLFAGADVVIHLACLFQPSHRPEVTWRTNVLGSERVFTATARAGVPALVHASSLVAYAPAPAGRRVDESWPTDGWPTAAYPREKAYTERLLDAFGPRYPDIRLVRMRPGVVVARETAAQQRRLFAGPFLPTARPPRPLRLVPALPGLSFQVLHPDDAADAFHRAALRPVRGAFNIATEPVVDARLLARLAGARQVPLPHGLARAAVTAAWRLRLLPTSPAMFDAMLSFPLLDTGRARRELDWAPRHSADEAVAGFLTGLREGAGGDSPPLRGRLPGGGRLRELATGVGGRP